MMKSEMRIWKGATFGFAALFLIMIFVFFRGPRKGDTQDKVNAATTVPSGQSSGNRAAPLTLREDNDPVLGAKNADISIVEFSDFECSYCARSFATAETDFRNSNYFKSGKVNWIYKHFPLNSIHPSAQKAAEAAECANRQGKFWDYHDMLFTNRTSLDVSSLKSYASQLGLNTASFDSCLDNDEAKSEVNKEYSLARAAGGRGTPYFVIVNNNNGRGSAVRGAVPFSQMAAVINSLF